MVDTEKYIDICMKLSTKTHINSQIVKLFEEMSELQKELCKMILYESQMILHKDNIIKEIVDVEIMLCQIKVSLGIVDKVNEIKEIKYKELEKKSTIIILGDNYYE